jgi:hypothetical protein
MPRGQKAKPPHESLLLIGKSIAKGMPWSVAFDINEKEYALFGSAMFYWSFLEHALYARTVGLAARAKIPVPPEVINRDFRWRLGAFRRLVETTTNGAIWEKWRKVIRDIELAKAGREHIAHNFWTYNPRRPDQFWSTDLRRSRPRSEPFDSDKLANLGRLLGEVNFSLLFPKKPTDRELGRGTDFSYMSRSFRKMVMQRPQAQKTTP